jgi:hypothetical protein
MKIVINHKLIKTRRLIGQITTVSALVTLGVGLVISFKAENTQTDLLTYSFLCLIVGFILSQIGIYFSSRWGRSPRPDETISQSLKGLDNKYTLYHYSSPVSHLLLGPAGIWVLLPYFQAGHIIYNEERGKWQQKGGNWFLKFFGQENLGRPDQDAISGIRSIKNYVTKNAPSVDITDPNIVLVFTNNKANIDANNAPIPTLAVSKLKDFIRRQAKQEPAQSDLIKEIKAILPVPSEEEK